MNKQQSKQINTLLTKMENLNTDYNIFYSQKEEQYHKPIDESFVILMQMAIDALYDDINELKNSYVNKTHSRSHTNNVSIV